MPARPWRKFLTLLVGLVLVCLLLGLYPGGGLNLWLPASSASLQTIQARLTG